MILDTIEGKIGISHGSMDYVAFGHGRKPVVLIPGLSFRRLRGSAVMLAKMYKVLTGEYRVVVFDRRDVIHEDITAADLADDIAEGMDALGIGRAHIVGISQGGMIAQYLALRHPEKTARIVLGVTLSRPNDTLREAIGTWTELVSDGNMKGFFEDMLYRSYSEAYVKKYRHIIPAIIRFVDIIPADRFITLANSCLTCNTYDRLGEIRSPVLVLGARKDRIVTARASEEIAEKLGCGIYMYDDLGHSAYEEAPDFNKRIYDFFTDKRKQGIR